MHLEPWRKGKRPVQSLCDDICFLFLATVSLQAISQDPQKLVLPFAFAPYVAWMRKDEQEQSMWRIQIRANVLLFQGSPSRSDFGSSSYGMGRTRRSFVGRKYYPTSMHSEQQVTTIVRS